MYINFNLIKNDTLNTCLHYTLYNNNFKLANLLILKGANESIVNAEGITPWQLYHNRPTSKFNIN